MSYFTRTGVEYRKRGRNLLLAKFNSHRRRAAKRGIGFELTFEEWKKIWLESGHLNEMGIKRGQYCMARPGDKGPYAIGNVKIIQCNENVSEANLGKSFTAQHRARIGTAHLGLKRSAEARRNMSLAKAQYYYELRNGRGNQG